MKQKDIDRFWTKVDKETTPDGCWNYTGAIGTHGYGAFWFNGKMTTAPIFSYESTHGPIPEGKNRHENVVMHICDNRKCCRPDHLRLGSQQDNMDDKVSKGRQPYGEKHSLHKLTEVQVLEIRALPKMAQWKIGKMYGVNQQAISLILSRKRWSHI